MLFYLIAIVLVIVSPLAVPVMTTVFYAARDLRQGALDAHAQRSTGALHPTFRATRTRAVPAEA
jgi:hypothetical protein